MRKRYQGFKLKSYNESFQHQGSTWDVIHKSADTIWAVELDKKGRAGGPVLKFSM